MTWSGKVVTHGKQREEVFLPFAGTKTFQGEGKHSEYVIRKYPIPLLRWRKQRKISNQRWHFYFKKNQVSQKYMLGIYARMIFHWGKITTKLNKSNGCFCTKFCVQKILLTKNDILGKWQLCSILLRQAFSVCLGEEFILRATLLE